MGRTSLYSRPCQQLERDEEDLSELLTAHAIHPAYGYRRLKIALGWGSSKTRRLMVVGEVIPLGVKPRKYTKSKVLEEVQRLPETRRNLLKEQGLVAEYFGHIWAEDFTYIKFLGKMYYVATVIDLYSRRIVGWALADHHNTDFVTEALLDGLDKHSPPAVLHQDQGTEYCSERYDIICLQVGIDMSFSAKGHPWENGFQESFYRYFKIEIKVKKLDRFEDLGKLHEAIGLQLHYYNHERIHSALGMSPMEFIQLQNQENNPNSQPTNTKTPTKTNQNPIPKPETTKQKLKQKYLGAQQMVTGVRDRVFGKVGA